MLNSCSSWRIASGFLEGWLIVKGVFEIIFITKVIRVSRIALGE